MPPSIIRRLPKRVLLAVAGVMALLVACDLGGAPEFTEAPTVEAFSAEVVGGSRLSFAWSARGAASYALYGVSADGDLQPLATEVARSASSFVAPIPDSSHQILRLVATNPLGQSHLDLEPLPNIVVSTADYDPYDGQGYVPEDAVPGTLRAVVADAEPGAIIGFAADITELELTGVHLEGGLDAHLYLTKDVTISGPEGGLTLRGASGYEPGVDADDGVGGFTYRSRVIFVDEGTNVRLENLTLTGGDFIFIGGGIYNAGHTTLVDSVVTGNRAWTMAGGIFNRGTMTIERSLISDNQAFVSDDEVGTQYAIRGGYRVPDGPRAAFAPDGYGGGIYNRGAITLIDSQVSGNHSRFNGGGIANEQGEMTLIRTSVTENSADHTGYTTATANDFSAGGGIYNNATLRFEAGEFFGNDARNTGGGLFQGRPGSAAFAGASFVGHEADYGGAIRHRTCGDASNLSFEADPAFRDNRARVTGPDLLVTDHVGTAYCASSPSAQSVEGGAIGTTGPVGEGLPTWVGR